MGNRTSQYSCADNDAAMAGQYAGEKAQTPAMVAHAGIGWGARLTTPLQGGGTRIRTVHEGYDDQTILLNVWTLLEVLSRLLGGPFRGSSHLGSHLTHDAWHKNKRDHSGVGWGTRKSRNRNRHKHRHRHRHRRGHVPPAKLFASPANGPRNGDWPRITPSDPALALAPAPPAPPADPALAPAPAPPAPPAPTPPAANPAWVWAVMFLVMVSGWSDLGMPARARHVRQGCSKHAAAAATPQADRQPTQKHPPAPHVQQVRQQPMVKG